MKDKFLAEELGLDPYEDFARNDEVLTENDFKFTSCDDCVHKVDNHFTETCMSCKRYYGCYFERK